MNAAFAGVRPKQGDSRCGEGSNLLPGPGSWRGPFQQFPEILRVDGFHRGYASGSRAAGLHVFLDPRNVLEGEHEAATLAALAFLLELLHVGLALGYLVLDVDVAGAVAFVAGQFPVTGGPPLLHRGYARGGGLIGRGEYVGLAGVALALDAGDDPVSRTHDVAAFLRVDPTVHVHGVTAVLAGPLAGIVRMAVVAHDVSFPAIGPALFRREPAEFAIFQSIVRLAVVQGVIAILEPLACLNNDRLLAELLGRHLRQFNRLQRARMALAQAVVNVVGIRHGQAPVARAAPASSSALIWVWRIRSSAYSSYLFFRLS
ncbi:hypothetical protein LMG7053_06089 [Achromobacter ruhlandii]|uniref:Uncharacterized protein n=1 Tax=Achromobacter ruhlandii TaxID=72557 RepID=A0ABM8M4D2_9BURK|nr:hypothetical protein LMG7053_06089 [Achromobacter ruhlandii]